MNGASGPTPRRFLETAVAAGTLAFLVALALMRLFPPSPAPSKLPTLPPAFLVSTGLLGVVSVFLERAVWLVRRERQRPFRQSLLLALVAGSLFTSAQVWGLSWLRLSTDAGDEAAGVNAFLFLFAVLHALHITVGLLFLSLVNVRARNDRYDHEYFWGVRLCAWYWHALGIIWLVILGAFGLASSFLYG